ncbi:hypothetical protein [Weissella confusa]|uniref:hypothetical protein n=1 Tax=Weissella confusa TaxID=1583 RepID=UPI0018982025|nr:hypothetical protein [Weissella confusa]
MNKNLMFKHIKSNDINRGEYTYIYGVDEDRTAEQPHVRIEFDDIRDVPNVFVDGELIDEINEKALISLMVDWNTDTETENHKEFNINYFDLTDKSGRSKAFRQATVI